MYTDVPEEISKLIELSNDLLDVLIELKKAGCDEEVLASIAEGYEMLVERLEDE